MTESKLWKNRVLVFAAIILGLVAVFFSVALALFGPNIFFLSDVLNQHPTDERLIAIFQGKRLEFEALREMIQSDEYLERVAPDFVRPEDYEAARISPERIRDYRRLFSSLRLQGGVTAYSDRNQVVTFIASAVGLGISGSAKGYEWRATPPEIVSDAFHGARLCGDLDSYIKANKGKHNLPISSIFRHIEGNWYLFYSE